MNDTHELVQKSVRLQQEALEMNRRQFQNLEEREQMQSVRDWLKAPDASINYNNAHNKCHTGTGQWLVEGPLFSRWLRQENSFLWLYGFAGCGKSVLCSTAIKHTLDYAQAQSESAVAFFFFSFNDESKQNASSALQALLLQLCGQIPGLQADLARLKESSNQAIPPVQTLLEHLQQGLTLCRHVYLLIDALDESPAETLRPEVLSMIKTMQQWQAPTLHLLITSRDIPDIRHHLQSLILNPEAESVNCRNGSVQQDILRFRWVECQLPLLRKCPRSTKHLEQCLYSLPRSLDETYERILCSIELRGEAKRILSLLCYAERPLRTDEVIEALAVDIDELEYYDPQSRFTGGADDLLRICPGLIEVDNDENDHVDDDNLSIDGLFINYERYDDEYYNDEYYDDEDNSTDDIDFFMDREYYDKSHDEVNAHAGTPRAKVVRIAHFSVQEYLLSNRIQTSKAADFALSGPLQHGRISKNCLLYLNHNAFLQQSLCPELVHRYCFAKYAAKYWHYHYRQADHLSAQQLLEVVVALLQPGRIRERWLRLYDPGLGRINPDEYQHPSSMYYASFLGIHDALLYILSDPDTNVDAQGGPYGNALQVASLNGHEKIVQTLLDRGADVNAEEAGYYSNALCAACGRGHDNIVQILLDWGADANAHNKEYGNALSAASLRGNETIVQMLLGRGVDVNARGGYYGNALQAASTGGREKTVQMLLDWGANVNTQEEQGFYGYALQAAVANGREKVVHMLLDHGADVDAQGERHGNALQEASKRGYKNIVQLLIKYGAK